MEYFKDGCFSFGILILFFQLHYSKNKLHSMKWWWCLLYTRPTRSVECLFIALARWLQQQFTGRQVAPLGPFILIPSYSVLPFISWFWMLSKEAAKDNFICFLLILPEPNVTIFRNRAEHANATDKEKFGKLIQQLSNLFIYTTQLYIFQYSDLVNLCILIRQYYILNHSLVSVLWDDM